MNMRLKKNTNPIKNVGLFCNARNEKNIKEWAAHHLLIGFDRIIIFDHKSDIPLKDVFNKFDKRVNTVRINLPDGNIKNKLMNTAVQIARKDGMDWFIYLDADEFIILHKIFKGIKHFLKVYSYADSIAINWVMFGSNNLVKEPDGLILENYTLSNYKSDKHVKSFVRPYEVKYSDNPHFYHMRNPNKMLNLRFEQMRQPYCFSELNIPFFKLPAYIAHYVFQSEETYKKRKIDLMADDGTVRQDLGKRMHYFYNQGINTQPQKYINNIKEFLKRYEN